MDMSNALRDKQPSKLNECLDTIPSSPPTLNASLDTLPASPPSLKPKKRPPVTPRSFKRFFTPRSSLHGSSTRSGVRAGRNNLKDILTPPSSLNRNGPAFLNLQNDNKSISRQFPDQPSTPTRKRKAFLLYFKPTFAIVTFETTIYTDPIDRKEDIEEATSTFNTIIEEPNEEKVPEPIPLHRSQAIQAAGPALLRNLAISRSSRVTLRSPSYGTGDEEGGIRILDTAKGDKAGFSQSFLTFQPHMNSIMDLEFSSDDKLLATASGDQSSHIIDMPTQTAVYCLSKHSSSVKRVQFQPGSNGNVVATCSRDGSINIWDLRYKAFDKPSLQLHCSLASDGDDTTRISTAKMKYPQVSNNIRGAHSERPRSKGQSESQSHREDISVTSISFLHPGREHLFVTSCESNACVRLWDMRTSYSLRRKMSTPVAITRQPESHSRYRQFGLTSLVFNGDGNRLYTLCRDGTVYAYSTPHLILGNSNELSLSNPPLRRFPGEEPKAGLGPLYGFRHPRLLVATFFVKLRSASANDNTSSLLSDNCAIVFPTNERYFKKSLPTSEISLPTNSMPGPKGYGGRRIGLQRTKSGTSLSARLEHDIPIYQHGSPLVEGHQKEVSAVSWTNNGELVTVSDDLHARCWREGPDARDLRLGGEAGGRRWNCGWAEVNDPEYDEEEC
uniref:WD repeat-containing protein n=1 Tax=Coccidioides posadasii RMSCC 3488 TaxID=454284 RepID=A0A0J6FBC2_COCPO|nr:LOW QUALITY PROTEIN: WD repeat-containing protein [Coccidioides posadasii RMSCC 3488]